MEGAPFDAERGQWFGVTPEGMAEVERIEHADLEGPAGGNIAGGVDAPPESGVIAAALDVHAVGMPRGEFDGGLARRPDDDRRCRGTVCE